MNKKNTLAYYIIGSAAIWGATMIGCALVLKETFTQVSPILSSAAAIHLVLIWGPLAAQLKKQRKEGELEN